MSEIKVTAHLSDGIKATGSLGKVVEVPVSAEPYTGDYDISVTDSDVVIPIQNKIATDDITVHQGRAEVPTYSGQNTFTVTDADITVQSKGFKFDDNLTVNQGIPLYTGATSFTIVDSGLTIATNGKRLNSDITVDISALEALAEDISEVVG